MSQIKFVEGKVYLKDTRNGDIYEYEPMLASMNFIERIVPLPAEGCEEIVIDEPVVDPPVVDPPVVEDSKPETKVAPPPPPKAEDKKA